MRSATTFVGIAFSCGSALAAYAEPSIESPYARYSAEIVRIIDGDTLEVKVALWPGLVAEYAVRVRGIDAPEIRRVGCEDEREWGEEAKRKVAQLYDVGSTVRLEDVEYDVFAGRVVADVKRWRSDRWLSFADELIERELAVEWFPKMDPVPWCLLAQTRQTEAAE